MTGSLKKLTAGAGLTYYTRQTAVGDATDRGPRTLSDYYSEKGERPGFWLGSGVANLGIAAGSQVSEAQMLALYGRGKHPDCDVILAEMLAAGTFTEKERQRASSLGQEYPLYDDEAAPLVVALAQRIREWNTERGLPADATVPADVRSALRSEVGRAHFREMFERDPDERELDGHVKRYSRGKPKACAGFDLTFTPVKSVSVLWAVGGDQVSAAIEKAHNEAVKAAVARLEESALYTRRGARGVRQVDVVGAVGTLFQHRDSRDGDPNLHSHFVLANKVQAIEDGSWLAVDGAAVYRNMVCISEAYNTALEVELNHRLGLKFEDRVRADGKRPVREVVGISPEVIEATSNRRAAINARRAVLADEFTARHGRPPTAVEAIKLAEKANLETRAAKHEPRSFNEQRAVWRRQIGAVVGGMEGIDRVLAEVRSARMQRSDVVAEGSVQAVAERAIATVEAGRARFGRHHVRAEVDRRVRAENLTGAASAALVEEATTWALDRLALRIDRRRDGAVLVETPAPLRRADGRSQYERADSDLFTTVDVMAAEDAVMAAARRRDGRRVSAARVERSIVAEAAGGVTLNAAQQAMVTELATSGARVQLALAPAGSGKTTAMKVLAEAWMSEGGTVLGLAPSAVAAHELQEAVGRGHVDTLAKLTYELGQGERSEQEPEWLQRVDEGTLIVVDEAGMASTRDLAAVVEFALARGASVRMVGDDQQLAAVQAGGVLRDLHTEVGAVTLTELMRFQNPEEGAATLALREGDAEAIGFYLDNGRVHLYDEATIGEAVYRAWKADVDAGRSSLMVAYSNEQAAELNGRARAERVDAGEVWGREVLLRSGLHASAGDVIITRKIDRSLRLSATDYVKNGDMFDVLEVAEDGSLRVRHRDTGHAITLPAVARRKGGLSVGEHIDLGYARTVHTAQGTTVDTCHVALSGGETRQLAYTAVTRGRHQNHLYLFAGGDGDPANTLDPDTVQPVTAGEILERIIGRDGSQSSARTAIREANDPTLILGSVAPIYRDAVGFAAVNLLDPEVRARIMEVAEQEHPGLTSAPAWDTLFNHLAICAANGDDPVSLLCSAIKQRPLDDKGDPARDPAAVLDWRLDPSGEHSGGSGPLPWLPRIPVVLAQHPVWGPYLAGLADDVDVTADRVRGAAANIPVESAPRWSLPVTGDRELMGDIAVWRAAQQVEGDDLELLGVHRFYRAPADVRAMKALTRRIEAHLGPKDAAPAPAWSAVVVEQHPHLRSDAYWPVVVRRIEQAAKAGIKVEPMLHAALARGPLPDEHPASALWYRLAATLNPIAATEGDPTSRLRPPWTDTLLGELGEDVGRRILRDPYWPSLVAAVSDVERHGGDAATVITDAVRAIGGRAVIGQPGGVPSEDLTVVLAMRIGSLNQVPDTDSPVGDYEAPPADVEELLQQLAATRHHQVSRRSDEGTRTAERRVPNAPLESAPVPSEAPTAVEDLPPDPANDTSPSATDSAAAVEVGTPAERILALNEAAAQWWADAYPDSPAEQYISDRFAGNSLSDDPRFRVGYAPNSWTGLVDHLRAEGASDTELVDAGLGRYSRRGTVIDAFRGRVMLGISSPEGDLIGFSGRILPIHETDRDRKYVNTATTKVFNKGATLFGLAENRDQLDAGAVPVLTEGPLDAIAVTLAGNGDAVGVAPSGTALTQAQVELIAAHASRRIGVGGARMERLAIVATDNDQAGDKAAARDFWMLQSAGIDTRVLPLGGVDTGKQDPADSYRQDQGQALSGMLAYPDVLPALSWKLIQEQITAAEQQDHAGARAHHLVQAAKIVAATPPERWDDDIDAIIERTHGDQWDRDNLTEAVIHEAINWHHDATSEPALTDQELVRGRLAAVQRRLARNASVRHSPTADAASRIRQRLTNAREQLKNTPTRPQPTPETKQDTGEQEEPLTPQTRPPSREGPER